MHFSLAAFRSTPTGLGRICLPAVAVTVALAACGGGGDDPAAPTPTELSAAQRCEQLVGKTLSSGDATVQTAAIRPARAASGPNSQGLPEYCDVAIASTDSALKIAARLPTERWNEKMVARGGGGFKGGISDLTQSTTGSASIVSDGYAVISNNGGHDASENTNAAFARDGVKLAEYAYLAEHRTALASKEVVELFYGLRPKKSYFEGCSTGGHDAWMEAQRFPQDYDGIIARAPASNFMGLYLQFNRISTAIRMPGGNLNVAKRNLLASAVLGQCDALDGAADGIIGKPWACNYNPDELLCVGGADIGDNCLSAQQVNTVRTITDPYVSPDGKWSHPGYSWGGENDPSGWGSYIWPNANTGVSTQMNFSDQWVRGFITKNDQFDPTTFRAADWLAELTFLGSMWQAFNPDLTALQARGSKVIVWNGSIDTSVTPRDAIRFHEAVVQKMGQSAADGTLETFIAAGVGHCSGGPGADSIDLIKAMDTWVNTGTPPSAQNLVMNKINRDGSVALSRPLCKYPTYARYRGAGDPTLASSYSCSSD